jgi:hypothetical protein
VQSDHWLSGKQLTTVVVAVCAAVVLTPVGVLASSRSSVSIADAKNPSRTAVVTKSGTQVISGSVKLSGTSTVKGTVATTPGLPGTPYSMRLANTLDTSTQTVPAGKQFRVTTVTSSVLVAPGVTVNHLAILNDATQVDLLDIPLVKGATVGNVDNYANTVTVDLVLAPGTRVGAFVGTSDGSDSNGVVVLYGYLI